MSLIGRHETGAAPRGGGPNRWAARAITTQPQLHSLSVPLLRATLRYPHRTLRRVATGMSTQSINQYSHR
jgi:hypothetical protein